MDRENVIKAFKICDNNEDGIVCKNCPYKEDKWNGAWEDETGETCFQTLHADVLALLKEQGAVVRCKDCKHYDKDMIYCNKFGIQNIDNDWFCADGERKPD